VPFAHPPAPRPPPHEHALDRHPDPQGPSKVVLAGQNVVGCPERRVRDIGHVPKGAFATLNVPSAPFATSRFEAPLTRANDFAELAA
jgi:hypothetical protein